MSTKQRTAAVRKTAISMPADLLAGVDAAARESGESRSRFIARILRTAVRARRDAEITRKLNELFADATIREEQRRETAALDRAGTDWSDERW